MAGYGRLWPVLSNIFCMLFLFCSFWRTLKGRAFRSNRRLKLITGSKDKSFYARSKGFALTASNSALIANFLYNPFRYGYALFSFCAFRTFKAHSHDR